MTELSTGDSWIQAAFESSKAYLSPYVAEYGEEP
jgi:hypothetical protein